MVREIELLRRIGQRVTLAVPTPSHVPAEIDSLESAFFAYDKIPGEPLTGEVLARALRPDRIETLAAQLTTFLGELHAMRIPDSPGLDGTEHWRGLFERIRAKLYPFMHDAARDAVSRHFDEGLAELERATYVPVLRHGDLGASNILYDEAAAVLTGVIDFDSAEMGDPALDYAASRASPGEDVYQGCATPVPEIAGADARVRFYMGTFALQEALYGLERGDREAFEAGIAPSRK